MRGVRRRNMLAALIAELWKIETGEEVFAAAEEDRRDGEMHLVDQAQPADIAGSSRRRHRPGRRGRSRPPSRVQRRVNTVGDEVKRRAAIHRDRRARMMGEHEHRTVIGRVVAPPAFPTLVRPVSPDGPEHVAAHDPGADIGKAARRKIVVDPGRAAACPYIA